VVGRRALGLRRRMVGRRSRRQKAALKVAGVL
jgi:hypothetical protein